MEVLKEIIQDYAPRSDTLNRVGLVGSFARGDWTEYSDIDLVFDTGQELLSEAIESSALMIRKILIDQFRLRCDIVPYKTILKYKDKDSEDIITMGYKKMFEDLIWLWER